MYSHDINNLVQTKNYSIILDSNQNLFNVNAHNIVYENDNLLSKSRNISPMVVYSPPYGPAQLKTVYNIPTVLPSPGKQVSKVAVIIAFQYANLRTDFETFCDANGITNKQLDIINIGTPAAANVNWAVEACLDIQTIRGLNPNAYLYIVQATSSSVQDIIVAINYAINQLNVDVISMSLGVNTYDAQLYYNINKQFHTNKNITFLASTGDNQDFNWPSYHPCVIGVGGTNLTIDTLYQRNNEIVWLNNLTGQGSGYANTTIFEKPSFQLNLNLPILDNTKRTVPDVSADGDPATGFIVYYNNETITVGGTSLSCPIVASLITLINQSRFNVDKNALKGPQFLTGYYNCILQPQFFDVILGSTGTVSAQIGFDLASGCGVPNFTSMINYFNSNF